MDETSSVPNTASTAPLDAQVTLPADPEAPEPAAPVDPYAGFNYEALIEEHRIGGMDAGELSQVYPDARHLVETYAGTDFSEGDGGLGNDPHILRALGRAGNDLRLLEDTFNTEFAKLPPGTRVKAPELSGADLEREIGRVVSDYLDSPAQRRAADAIKSPEGRGFLERVAKARYQLRASLSAMHQLMPSIAAKADAAKERQELAALAPGVQAMSEREYDAKYGALFHQMYVAEKAGNLSDVQRLSFEIAQLQRARYERRP